jgi:hypothetical protein
MLLAATANAEELLSHVLFGVGSGGEAGDASGALAWRRARTRFVSGLDLRWDEGRAQGFSFRGFVEVEQRASLGGDVRYTAWATRGVGLFGGVTAIIAPETLWGGVAGAEFVIPLGNNPGIFIEPSVSAFPIGSDLPEGSVVVWASLALGVRVGI